ncbi:MULTISPECIES: hypothetical protein [unclassified Bradyrhizobium]|uniref:hypothetical protein n=1 Tax=unclassified Bradyrhizobium TaxID=2631580 RepID=UPI002915DACD|nr:MULTISPECIES: hypothetical protein [unclassified Bradyrhizobium]
MLATAGSWRDGATFSSVTRRDRLDGREPSMKADNRQALACMVLIAVLMVALLSAKYQV